MERHNKISNKNKLLWSAPIFFKLGLKRTSSGSPYDGPEDVEYNDPVYSPT